MSSAAGTTFAASLLIFVAVTWLSLRPFSWRRFLGRCPILLVTAGVLLLIAAAVLPRALPTLFERSLGHPIHGLVRVSNTEQENWDLLWDERVGAAFKWMILGSAVWAIANLLFRNAVRLNAIALLVLVGWVLLFVWVAVTSFTGV